MPSTSNKWLDQRLNERVKKRAAGAIGVELELEGIFPDGPLDKFMNDGRWRCKEEHSLRGGLEFVLHRPLNLPELDSALKSLSDLLKDSVVKPTIRCSTHIHINVLRLTNREIFNVLGYYYLIEDLLINTQGPMRIGNLFCLSMSDAESISSDLLYTLDNESFSVFSQDSHKYGALNLAALNVFGSLEFRFFRPLPPDKIYFWSKLLNTMVDRAKALPIRTALEMIESQNYNGLLELVFTPDQVTFLTGSSSEWRDFLDVNYGVIWKLERQLDRDRKFKLSRNDLADEIDDSAGSPEPSHPMFDINPQVISEGVEHILEDMESIWEELE